MDQMLRLRNNLKRFAKEVNETLPAALDKNAEELVEDARTLAPENEGRIKESGRHYIDVDMEGVRAYVIFGKGTDTPEFDDVFHAAFREFGTKQKGGTATPFLFPAYRNKRKRFKSRIKRFINKAAKNSVR